MSSAQLRAGRAKTPPKRFPNRGQSINSSVSRSILREVPSEPFVLTYGQNTNYGQWKVATTRFAITKFGNPARFMITGEAFLPPFEARPTKPILRDLLEDEDEYPVDELAEFEVELEAYEELMSEWSSSKHLTQKSRQYIKDEGPKVYNWLMELISPESREKVRDCVEYVPEIELAQNPVKLWKRIESCHLLGLSRVQEFNVITAWRKHYTLSQTQNERLVDFKKRFDDSITTIQSLGEQLPDGHKAVSFLFALNAKYGQLRVSLENNAAMGIQQIPQSLTDMYITASEYKVVTAVVVPAQSAAAFATTGKPDRSRPATSQVKSYKAATAAGGKDKTPAKIADAKSESKGASGRALDCYLCHGEHRFTDCPTAKEFKQWQVGKKEMINVTMSSICQEDYNEVVFYAAANFPDPAPRRPRGHDGRSSGPLTTPFIWIILDTGATQPLFGNRKGVCGIRPATIPRNFVGSTGGTLHVAQVATAGPFGCVYYDDRSPVNVLSMSCLVVRGVHVDYSVEENTFIVRGSDGSSYFFQCVEGTYAIPIEMAFDYALLNVTTVTDNERLFTEREVKQAKVARDLLRRMGFPSVDYAVRALRGALNCPVTATDFKNAETIYGKDIAVFKGKTTLTKSNDYRAEPIDLTGLSFKRELELHVDIMFVNGVPFFVSLSTPLGLTMVSPLGKAAGARSRRSLETAVHSQTNQYTAHGFKVNMIHSDNEAGLVAAADDFAAAGMILNTSGPGQHVSHIERKLREIKEHARCVFVSLPFKLHTDLLPYLISFVVHMINMVPHRGDVYPVSARELFLNRRLDVERDLRCSFGDYCMCVNPVITNDTTARTTAGIALLPTGNRQGSVKFLDMTSNTIIIRDKFTVLPMPTNVICFMNHQATLTNTSAVTEILVRGVHSLTEDDQSATDAVHGAPDAAAEQWATSPDPDAAATVVTADAAPVVADVIVHDHRVDDTPSPVLEHSRPVHSPSGNMPAIPTGTIIKHEYVDDVVVERADGTLLAIPRPSTVAAYSAAGSAEVIDLTESDDEAGDTSPEIEQDNQAHFADDEPNTATYTYNTESDDEGGEGRWTTVVTRRRTDSTTPTVPAAAPDGIDQRPAGRTRSKTGASQSVIAFDRKTHHPFLARGSLANILAMSAAAALREFPDAAKEAMTKELTQIIKTKGVLHPVHPREARSAGVRPVSSFMFVTEKLHPDGSHDKIKARLVGGGHQQDRNMIDNVSSPTIDITKLFTVLGIAAHESRFVSVGDIPGAYLNASMDKPGVAPVYMTIGKDVVPLVLEIDPSYKDFILPNGTVVVKLDKALYGLIESGKLWYEHLTGVLVKDGYKPNPLERCVFNKTFEGAQVTIAIYVDDLVITSTELRAVAAAQNLLIKHFGAMKFSHGLFQEYLGMLLDFSIHGRVSVSMPGYVDELLSSTNTVGTAESPAGLGLFNVRNEARAMGPEDVKMFVTLVYKLLYLAKHFRFDLLAAIAFLTTRVQHPDQDDYLKLQRVLKYLNRTRHQKLTIQMDGSYKVEIAIDASYGVHPDMKSHGGAVITLGKGAVWARSYKIKLNTKSSTESEYVAVSDNLGEALHLREFLLAQGYACPPVLLRQDNMSTIQMLKNGRGSSLGTRHISIRYFWIRDRIEIGDLIVEHLPTEDMVADVLTKPIAGAPYLRLAALLLNTPE